RVGARLDDQEIGAERLDPRLDGLAGAARHRHHDDHRRNADDHPKQREEAPQRIEPERHKRGLEGGEVAHAASSTMTPSRKVRLRCALAAMSSSWVTRITVMPPAFSSSNSAMI